ncbi:WxL domain-containing protein [Levilactobacillus brevis]|uniref:WxL domain-containing protein n=1 Tax=Levilactobacillus brevis TaxID=1580 RepID=UPI001BAE07B7|nr:WxL domain-containing protein [Levilactobacillus brevis]MBS1012724.1 WxL domain-containing protein [Levilactobacillus brevis]
MFRASSGNGRDLSTNVWAPEDVSLTLLGQTAVRGETYTTTINWTLTASVS